MSGPLCYPDVSSTTKLGTFWLWHENYKCATGQSSPLRLTCSSSWNQKKKENMAMSSIPTAVHGLRPYTHARPKTLDQFESRQEVLFALRDAVVGRFPVHSVLPFCGAHVYLFRKSSQVERISSRPWKYIDRYYLYWRYQVPWCPRFPHKPRRLHCMSPCPCK